MPKKTFVCENCGSDDVRKEASAEWDVDRQEWVLASWAMEGLSDDVICNNCGDTNATLVEAEITDDAISSNPSIRITTPFADAEVAISDLSAPQRNALAELLGLKSAKAEVFKKLAELKPFQKISRKALQEVSACKNYPHEVEVKLTPIEAPKAVKMISEIMPEATCSPMMHTLSTACKRCGSTHYVERRSILVRTVVAGVPFNKLYEI